MDNCLHFSLNTKPILGKIAAELEHLSVNESNFVKTAAILQNLEQYLEELSFPLNCDLMYKNCTVAGILKAVGISIRDEYDDPLERLLDYMELVREFDRDKLFVLLNLRSFFADEHVEKFLETVSVHGYKVLLLDSVSRKKLALENRITIDNDLCEF